MDCLMMANSDLADGYQLQFNQHISIKRNALRMITVKPDFCQQQEHRKHVDLMPRNIHPPVPEGLLWILK